MQVGHPRRRWIASLLVVAVTLAACTDAADPASSTVSTRSTSSVASEAQTMMQDRLGVQAVQDFLIHLELGLQLGEEVFSVIGQVLERARSGAAAEVDMGDGFTLRPVDSLVSRALEASGDDLPNISVDFAILATTPEISEELDAALLSAFGTGELETALAEVLATGYEPEVLVEIVTASYEDRLTHVGPGDLSVMDLSFLEMPEGAVSTPPDGFVSVHLFGQTLPGDPQVEAGMSPHELFAYRWGRGLIQMFGTGSVPEIVVTDTSVTAPDVGASEGRLRVAGFLGAADAVGSSVPQGTTPLYLPQNIKTFLVARFQQEAFLTALKSADDAMARARSQQAGGNQSPVIVSGVIHDTGAGRFRGVPMHCLQYVEGSGIWIGLPREDDAPGHCEVGGGNPVDPAAYKFWSALNAMKQACVALSGHMRKANEAAAKKLGTPPPGPGPECADPASGQSESLPPGGGFVGDIHMFTFDQALYGNQAAGEFMIFDNGDAEIQARTEPWGGDSPFASTATAVAVRVGNRVVSMHQGGLTWIDGEPVEMERGVAVGLDAGSLLWTGLGWVVLWPDGTEAHIEDLEETESLSLMVYPVPGSYTGMLGDGDGDPDNDFITRSGELLSPEWITDLELHYGTFVESWRITQDESLFHYGPGESTDTFQLEGHPSLFPTMDELDQVARQAAEESCRAGGVTRPDILEGCVFDVTITGDEAFVYGHFSMQESLPPISHGSASDGANQITVGALRLGGFSLERCSADPLEFTADGSFTDPSGRQVELTIQHAAVEPPILRVFLRIDGQYVAWADTTVDPPSAVLETVLSGASLTATGAAFLNEPYDPNLIPTLALPPGSTLVPFDLRVSCDR